MSKFNQTKPKATTRTTNLAGGSAYTQTHQMELLSILLTSFGGDNYYRTGDATVERLKTLISLVDKKFVAQAAVYARTVHGMRTITHIAAASLAPFIGGEPWARGFYEKIVFRPDDMNEILAYHKALGNVKKVKGRDRIRISKAMQGGFAKAFDKFNTYNLAKYRAGAKDIKLIDIVNLVHPKPTDGNKEALEALVKNELKSFDTWESELSGNEGDEVKNEATWTKLLSEKKLGYIALLRNLRNIAKQAPKALPMALEALTNLEFIRKAKIFPFQYLIAYKQFKEENTKEARLITDALAKAVDLSCVNVKDLEFSGDTLVVYDSSGSMSSLINGNKYLKYVEVAALFGIIFAKGGNGDIMEFADRAQFVKYSLSANSLHFAESEVGKSRVGHGTNLSSVFQLANKKYDRVLIFSDMQTWHGGSVISAFANYKKKFDANPFIYSFDLAGLGTTQFFGDRTYQLAGYSDKVINTMKYFETDKNALINEVKTIEL